MSVDVYQFCFTLPVVLRLGVVVGRHQPCLHGCVLTVDDNYRVEIRGPFRERVYDQARRFLRVHGKGHGPLTIPATLRSPAPGRGADSVAIAIEAEVSFAFTAFAPDVGAPALQTILSAG